MTFDEAVAALKQGGRVRRERWAKKDMHLHLAPDAQEDGSPAFLMSSDGAKDVPWLASKADKNAMDWEGA